MDYTIYRMNNMNILEEKTIYCPICGEDAESLFMTWNNQILGCDNCVVIKPASIILDEQKEKYSVIFGGD